MTSSIFSTFKLFGVALSISEASGRSFVLMVFDESTWIRFRLTIKRYEGQSYSDARKIKNIAPTNAGPKSVKRIYNLIAHGDDGRIVTLTNRMTLTDSLFRVVDDSINITVYKAYCFIHIFIGKPVNELRSVTSQEIPTPLLLH